MAKGGIEAMTESLFSSIHIGWGEALSVLTLWSAVVYILFIQK